MSTGAFTLRDIDTPAAPPGKRGQFSLADVDTKPAIPSESEQAAALQAPTLAKAHQRSLVPMDYEGMSAGVPNKEQGVPSVPPALRPPGETLGQDVTRELGPQMKWAGGAIGGMAGGVPGATLGGAAGEAGNQLLQHAFTPESAPKSSLSAAGGIGLSGAETGAAELGGKVVGKLGGAVGRRVLGPSVPTQTELSLAQRALKPRPTGADQFQTDLAASRPYLSGVNSQAELKTAVPTAKNEIWQPYKSALDRIGNNPAVGPDGPTTFGELEAERLKTSANLRQMRSMKPTDQQSVLQKDGAISELLKRDADIKAVLDPALQNEGINPELIRQVHGNVQGIGRLVSGRNTIAEQPQRYGLGKISQALNPLNRLGPQALKNTGSITGGIQDIAEGRPWWSGKPTDVGIQQGLQAEGGPKPDFRYAPPPSPVLPPVPQSKVGTPAAYGLNAPLPPPAGPSASLQNFHDVPSQPVSPQEVADLSRVLGRPISAAEVPGILRAQAAEQNIHTGLAGNRADAAGNIRELHRAKLEKPSVR